MVTETTVSIGDFVLDAIAVTAHLDRNAVDRETNLVDIGLDSFNRVAVISQIEAHFHLEFTSDDLLAAFEARQVAQLIELIGAVADRPAR